MTVTCQEVQTKVAVSIIRGVIVSTNIYVAAAVSANVRLRVSEELVSCSTQFAALVFGKSLTKYKRPHDY